MSEPVRWGLLSTARINRAILDGARQSEHTQVVAVASRDQARADAYARERGLERAYGSYEALLEDDDLDVVYNSLPNSLHVDWSIRALDAGKHVLCEKPLDRRVEAVERAFDAAERNGRLLMEAFMYRHHPQTRKAAELVRDGAIGELRQLRSLFSFTLTDEADVRMLPELDGGALMDLGCYCISMQRLLAGEPDLVFGRQRLGGGGVDVGFVGVLQFPGEVFGEFHCGFDLPQGAGLEAIGSKGKLAVADPVRCRDPHVVVDGERIDVEDVDRYFLQVENFSAAVRGEAEPLLGPADAMGQVRTIDALYRSAATGSAERL
ncbi:MAG TPA: Gfo/Idh/MocA family oxidoreductase [Gaiellaceae bacterium]|nr:Gfo/Idh/MocA family oxidoreductase [Gaiellaceae bacterium]